MFSQTVEYALRAMVYLAANANTAQTTSQIAKATMVPQAYLSKVLQELIRAGLVSSQRGLRGGMTLINKPDKTNLLDVVNAVEPIVRLRVCPLGLGTHGAKLCPLHQRMDDALASVENAFGNTTLADILAEQSSSIPLCDFPPATVPIKNA